MYLGELALIIDATLGFSSAATHMFSGNINGEQRVYTAQPAAGEYDENDLTVQDMPETMSYIYDAGANWNINVQVLGPSLSLIHISEPTRLSLVSRMPSSA